MVIWQLVQGCIAHALLADIQLTMARGTCVYRTSRCCMDSSQHMLAMQFLVCLAGSAGCVPAAYLLSCGLHHCSEGSVGSSIVGLPSIPHIGRDGGEGMHCFQRRRPQMPCHVQKSDDLQCRARASNHWHAHTTMFKTAQKPLIIACKCAMENIAQLLVN